MKADKHLFDHIVYDSTNERKFAQELDVASDVAVYVKLPDGFYIWLSCISLIRRERSLLNAKSRILSYLLLRQPFGFTQQFNLVTDHGVASFDISIHRHTTKCKNKNKNKFICTNC